MIFRVVLLSFFLIVKPSYAAITHYDIDLTYEDENHTLVGSEVITFTNGSERPVSTLYLSLYPNIYEEKHPNLSSAYYQTAYPMQFNPGALEIITVKDSTGETLLLKPAENFDRRLVKVLLLRPISSGETVRFTVDFRTTIPEKRGVFGYVKSIVTLQGGWHPTIPDFSGGKWHFNLPPPKSNFRIRLSLNNKLQLASTSQIHQGALLGKNRRYQMEGKNLSYFSLSIGEKVFLLNTKISGVEVDYFILKRDKRYAKQVVKTIESALSFYQTRIQTIPDMRIQLASSYLYQDLVAVGSKVLYLNNRLFKVFTSLKRFHKKSIASGLFQILWREKRPDEELWVIEGLARIDAEAFIKQQDGKTFRLKKWLKPLSFLPLVDQVLYSKALPLRQVYFTDSVIPIISEDIRFYNQPASERPKIFTKLKKLVGESIFNEIVEKYREYARTGKTSSFREILSILHSREIDTLIDEWLYTRPILDFKIGTIERKKADDRHQTNILIEKAGHGREPIEILVKETKGRETSFLWNGSEETHQIRLSTLSPVKTVELDPQGDINDPNRQNNRSPAKWKILLDEFNADFDFQTNTLNYGAGFFFQKQYDTSHWTELRFSSAATGHHIQVGYTEILKKNHFISIGVTHEKLETSRNSFIEDEAGFLTLGYAFVFPDIPLLAESIQKLTTTFPSFNISLVYNQQFTGGIYDHSFLLRLDARRTWTFSNYHAIGSRIFVGQSAGNLFENRRFFLGGVEAMRGYNPLVFVGENMSLFSLEYRFPLFYDSDINFFGLTHAHAWQLAFFADTGMVSDSRNVFRTSEFKSDVGTGIRFFVDLFGIYPAILRFDVAMPIAPTIEDEDKPHYYLTAGQPF